MITEFKEAIAELDAVLQDLKAHAEAAVERFDGVQHQHAKALVEKLGHASVKALVRLEKLLGVKA